MSKNQVGVIKINFHEVDIIKINFYGTIMEIRLYDKLYIWGLIEYIFDNIFGVIHAWICENINIKQYKILL